MCSSYDCTTGFQPDRGLLGLTGRYHQTCSKNDLRRLQKETSDLVNILSLVTKKGLDLGEWHNEPHASEPESSADHKIDHAKVDADAIMRNALNRLAEVLARFKTVEGARARGKHNRDAKHVTSVIMVEDTGVNPTASTRL